MLQLGEAVNDPDAVTSRSIAVEREKEGEQQAPWHISFHLEAEDGSNDDGSSDDSNDSF